MPKEEIITLATGRTDQSTASGSSVSSATTLEPVIWLQEIVDAAQKRFHFRDAVMERQLDEGQKDLVIPKRDNYLASGGVSYASSAPSTGSQITATKIDNLDGVTFTPSMNASRVSISNYALRTNAIDHVQAAQDELVYSIGDKVDQAIATSLGDAQSSTSSSTGMQTIFGGTADRDSNLSSGDVLTTDLVAQARKLLMTSNKQYRANTGTGGGYGSVSGTVSGNSWKPTSEEPFILFISPDQEETLVKSSQFVNASEYGGREVILNGEIGQLSYLGIRVVVTNNVEKIASGNTGPDAESANTSVDMTRCLLVKANRCGALVWGSMGSEPVMKVWDNAPEVSQEVILEHDYDTGVVQPDAIVAIDVADE